MHVNTHIFMMQTLQTLHVYVSLCMYVYACEHTHIYDAISLFNVTSSAKNTCVCMYVYTHVHVQLIITRTLIAMHVCMYVCTQTCHSLYAHDIFDTYAYMYARTT
jgi:hypothetical protein